jgi:DNA-binding IclR family transcriptional regulator
MLVKQAANVIDLMEYFAERKKPSTLAQIADDLNWPRSSTFNIIGTLADKGYLYEPKARGGYYPSPRWLVMAQAVGEAEPLPEEVQHLVAHIARETGETTAIGSAASTSVILLHVIESKRPIRYFAQVGTLVPIQASSAGRAILAQFTPEERRALYKKIKFERYSKTSPVNAAAVEAELKAAAKRGYHQSNSEYIADLAGVSLPLPVGMRRLSLVVAGPVSRCLERRPDTAKLIEAAMQRFLPKG